MRLYVLKSGSDVHVSLAPVTTDEFGAFFPAGHTQFSVRAAKKLGLPIPKKGEVIELEGSFKVAKPAKTAAKKVAKK